MINLLCCFVFVSCVFFIIMFYLYVRNNQVHKFLNDNITNENYSKLPCYNVLLFSLKPLKLKYWIKEK